LVDRTCFGHFERRAAFARRRRASGVLCFARRAALRAFFRALTSFFRADVAARRAFLRALIAARLALRAATCSGVPRRVLRRFGAARRADVRDFFAVFRLVFLFFLPNVFAYPAEYAALCARDIERERFGRSRRFVEERFFFEPPTARVAARMAPAFVRPRFLAALNATRRFPARLRAAVLPMRVDPFLDMRFTNEARWTLFEIMLRLLVPMSCRALATRSVRERPAVAWRADP